MAFQRANVPKVTSWLLVTLGDGYARVTLDAIFPYARDLYSYPDLLEEGLQLHKVKEVLLWGSED